MNIKEYIQSIQLHLIRTHQRVIAWFDENDAIKSYQPQDNGWTVLEILEHIALTSHFLLKLIDKGADKALRNTHNLSIEEIVEEEELKLDRIDRIGMHKSFTWIRPAHMEPTRQKSEFEIVNQLIEQLNRCLNQLDRLKEGEGLRHKTTMSVDGLGKINVYEYILFLSKHAERHLYQMRENRDEYISKKENLIK